MKASKNQLTELQIRHAEPAQKLRKLNDGGGLWMHISPDGAKRWIFRYWIAGRESSLAFGTWPERSLAQARKERDKYRAMVSELIDPAKARREQRQALVDGRKKAAAASWTFRKLVDDWQIKEYSKQVAEATRADLRYRMERDVMPWLGDVAAADIQADDVRAVIQRVRDRGAVEQARRYIQVFRRVFRYGRAEGIIQHDPAADLRVAKPVSAGFKAELDPAAVGVMLRAMCAYPGAFTVRMALRLLPMLLLRPGELRALEWSCYNEKDAELRLPPEAMKKKGAWHIVPLATQAVAVLDELKPYSGGGRYVFPGRDDSRCLSENTLRQALRTMGFDVTPHGFRKTASTLLNESGRWHRDAIERQLAHMERDAVRAAYNYAEHLPERKLMMQAWADYLDGLRGEGSYP